MGNFVAEGHPVPSGHGWTWIAGAWKLFKRQPGTWVAIAIIAIVVFIAYYFMRAFGNILGILLTPVFTAGGVILLGFAVLASIPLCLGWLVLGPVIGASIYTSYRDIYFT